MIIIRSKLLNDSKVQVRVSFSCVVITIVYLSSQPASKTKQLIRDISVSENHLLTLCGVLLAVRDSKHDVYLEGLGSYADAAGASWFEASELD